MFNPHAPAEGQEPTRGGRLIVEADGGSRGNPGHAGYGALVRDPASGAILSERAAYIGKASNNVAEYSGLVAGLELALEIDPGARIHVKMDSKLVVEQMSGRWQIKHADMRVLAGKARKVVDPRNVTYEWIPRERNKDADRLSNEAMDAGMAGVDWVPRNTVRSPVGEVAEFPKLDGDPPVAAAGRPKLSGRLHHIEIWVADLDEGVRSIGWLLERLGFPARENWKDGVSYGGEGFYVVLESGPDVAPEGHHRRRPGVNHLAFAAGTRSEVDVLSRRAASHGWTLLFADRHPFAGGPGHYAAYLENEDGFEVELVADEA
ncbi:reverse transcriptase-like protein [Arthrobacter sp. Br18]|uniref:reverse transcriptase-like protein n=1 Tax=Arthrobacter sp. Br18 TaxID=1312954 RepID=UPI00068461AD|nr:reverse transcriptase-like protein [Arthrobacter sp. Br18]